MKFAVKTRMKFSFGCHDCCSIEIKRKNWDVIIHIPHNACLFHEDDIRIAQALTVFVKEDARRSSEGIKRLAKKLREQNADK